MTQITDEEWQRRFPVLEMELTKQGCKISLADDKACLKATLPKQLLDTLFTKWTALQAGDETTGPLFGRWYTGEWDKQTTAPTEREG